MESEQPTATPNKHELRTRETRELLLSAAQTVFVRDGYEKAELGEIAAIAGRTKGAIYAQFKSKEDIFFALIERRARHYRSEMEKAIASSKSTEENMKLFRQLTARMIQDPSWMLLNLEFKLYVIRHPESRERFQKHYDEFLPANQEKRLASLLGAVKPGKNAISRSVAVQVFQPIFSALAVEASFAPSLLEQSTLKKVAERILDALFL
jgi:AcrR family transcriptional regulator